MLLQRSLKHVSPLVLLALVASVPTTASICPAPEIFGPIVNPHVEGTVIFWEPLISYQTLTLRVSAPCGDIVRTFKQGETPFFDVREVTREVDGRYAYELEAQPQIDPAVQDQLAEVRGTPQEQMVVLELWDKGLLPRGPFNQAGSFQVVNGLIADPNEVEKGASARSVTTDGGVSARFPGSDGGSSGGVDVAGSSSIRNISAADFVIIDDLIVDGSACIGFDCVNGESFGFDTIRLKENNLRIKFDDTSTAASFPRNDWQITANDSANGGQSKFSIDDISGSRTPFTIEANARSHSLYVDDGGRIGIRTSTPSVEIHVVDGDTPTLRLQQDGSSGFAPQTWDVAGNETSFFIRDVTSGSTLPFRIRPGADSNSLVIDADDDVGVGTLSPTAPLHVVEGSGTEAARTVLKVENNGVTQFDVEDTSADGSVWTFETEGPSFRINKNGTGAEEVIIRDRLDGTGNATMVVDGSVQATNVTFTSSRDYKTGFVPVDTRKILERFVSLPMSEWRFKEEKLGRRHIGPVAEDFNATFDLDGSQKQISVIDASGITMAAVQGLYGEVVELRQELQQRNQEIERLEQEKADSFEQLKTRIEELEALVRDVSDK